MPASTKTIDTSHALNVYNDLVIKTNRFLKSQIQDQPHCRYWKIAGKYSQKKKDPEAGGVNGKHRQFDLGVDVPYIDIPLPNLNTDSSNPEEKDDSLTFTPGNPNITGSTFIVEGNSVTLTCTSSSGNPVPTVYWYRNRQLVDDTQTTTNGVTTNTYTLVADKSHHFAVFECQVDKQIEYNMVLPSL
ncbi:unnamed protein product [Mytilus coruscus]|uniref:Ig-like domain-containing protein n=1 Tax=Mytilus coruscus TaxID=42192 RepID=A0A6J8A9U4_MYTCO|nr:unnamed protein product [Mytilus coruscus]